MRDNTINLSDKFSKIWIDQVPDNPYLLLTPGPLSTTKTVKAAMLKDWCTWDDDYNLIVQEIRHKLVNYATNKSDQYTSVLMQGSGTFAVEAMMAAPFHVAANFFVLLMALMVTELFKFLSFLALIALFKTVRNSGKSTYN